MIGITFDTATTSLADNLITQAENEVKKFLSKRYDLGSATFATSTSIPPVVTTITEWLATGYMHDSMSRGSKDSFKRADRFINRAMDNLKEIAGYKLDLLDTAGSVIVDKSTTSYQVLTNTDTYSNTFDEDDPLNWAVNSNKLEDIADGRE
jgi:hypothetical protein